MFAFFGIMYLDLPTSLSWLFWTDFTFDCKEWLQSNQTFHNTWPISVHLSQAMLNTDTIEKFPQHQMIIYQVCPFESFDKSAFFMLPKPQFNSLNFQNKITCEPLLNSKILDCTPGWNMDPKDYLVKAWAAAVPFLIICLVCVGLVHASTKRTKYDEVKRR